MKIYTSFLIKLLEPFKQKYILYFIVKIRFRVSLMRERSWNESDSRTGKLNMVQNLQFYTGKFRVRRAVISSILTKNFVKSLRNNANNVVI